MLAPRHRQHPMEGLSKFKEECGLPFSLLKFRCTLAPFDSCSAIYPHNICPNVDRKSNLVERHKTHISKHTAINHTSNIRAEASIRRPPRRASSHFGSAALPESGRRCPRARLACIAHSRPRWAIQPAQTRNGAEFIMELKKTMPDVRYVSRRGFRMTTHHRRAQEGRIPHKSSHAPPGERRSGPYREPVLHGLYAHE